ncbi:MAG: hypothetical protein GYA36_12060 [Veillonellaceae bacterium]|nr:hypothetical protein [Veillonellaceae bacterium]
MTGKHKIIWAVAGLVLAGLIGLTAADQWVLRDSKILPGVHVANVDVGGLYPAEAATKLRQAADGLKVRSIAVAGAESLWQVRPQDIDFSIDVNASIAAAYSAGRDENFVQRWQTLLMGQERPISRIPATVDFNREKLVRYLAGLAAQTDRDPVNASLRVSLKNNTVVRVPAVIGRKLNIEQTIAQAALKASSQELLPSIKLVFDQRPPQVTDEQFVGIDTVLASFSTYFKPWDADRNANLRLAASRINGKVLKPGEVFSYNNVVGHRTQKEGFLMAPVILDGKLVPDWGGGVCQVSSTLYNAVLLADLDIVDRSNHARAIGYVPLGFDATVVDGQIDFKFRNNLKRPILLQATVAEDELTFAVLGNAKDAPPPIELDYVVHKVIEPVEIKQPDPTLEAGKEVIDESPQRGFRVSTYRVRTIKGKQVSQLLYTDDYDPVNRIIKVGTKGLPPQAETTPKPTASANPPKSGTAVGKPKPTTAGTITLNETVTSPKR